MFSIENVLLGASVLLLLSILASKATDKLGVPSLLIFLVIGMLAGSEGPGGIHFDDPYLSQFVGVAALSFILFAGGLDTGWGDIRPVLSQGIMLSTTGVLITALLVGWFVHIVLGFTLLQGMLLGAIISSTDAAAVFSVLRSRKVSLGGKLRPLLELESGSNDPMAVMLTLGFIRLLLNPGDSVYDLIPMVLFQMSVGGIVGYCAGYGMSFIINHLRLGYEGLYTVFSLSIVPFTYGLTALLEGNGFLAVYVAGLVLGNRNFIHKKSLMRFHDGLAWLMQISMFLVLGLLVFPSRVVHVTGAGLLVSVFLMFAARPAGVFASMIASGMNFREQVMVSWVGLRGAVPIILATFPLLAGVQQADMMFNVVFFIVLTSALLQGTTIPFVARRLRVDAPFKVKTTYPIECEPTGTMLCDLADVDVPDGSTVIDRQIVDIGLPEGALIVIINRNGEFLVPGGGTVLKPGDRLLVLADRENVKKVRSIIAKPSGEQL
jgi:cell volume regulation protein A